MEKILINQHELLELMDRGIHAELIKSRYDVIVTNMVDMSWSLGGVTLHQSILKNDVKMAAYTLLEHSGMDLIQVTAYMQNHWHLWREHFLKEFKDSLS